MDEAMIDKRAGGAGGFSVTPAPGTFNEFFRLFFSNSAGPATIIDYQGNVVQINRALAGLFNLDTDAIIGRHMREFVPDNWKDLLVSFREVMDSDEGLLVEKNIKFLNDKRNMVISIQPLKLDEDGNRAVLAIGNDITELRKTQEALQESEENFRALANNASEAIVILDENGDHLFFNQKLVEIVGRPKQDVWDNDFRKSLTENEVPKIEGILRNLINDEAIPSVFETQVRRPDGNIRYIEITGAHTVWRGKPAGMGFIRDVTERREAEIREKEQQQYLIQADKLISLGILVSGVAHEINNPNQYIMSNNSVLKHAWKDAIFILDRFYQENGDFVIAGMDYSLFRDRLFSLISGVEDGCTRIRNFVEELRDFARTEPKENLQYVNINSVVQTSWSLLKNLVESSTDHFRLNLGENLPVIHGSFQRLEQVTINLIKNACQALEDRSEAITVTTSYDADSNCVVVTVEDEGTGIPEDRIRFIKDPFFTTKRTSGGMGLGLSISTRILNDHKGNLEIKSDPGKGTIAIATIPAVDQTS